MNEATQDKMNIEIAEIERLIQEFKEKFVAGTANADDFMNISQVELLWGELQSRTNDIFNQLGATQRTASCKAQIAGVILE